MKKILLWIFILFSLFINSTNQVFWYWEFYPAPLNIEFIDHVNWWPLSNYEVRLRTEENDKARFVYYTNNDWVLDVIASTPLELTREKWEYAFSLDIWLSRFVVLNEKLQSWIKVYYDKDEWYIKKIEWIESRSDYIVRQWEKWLKQSVFPSWTWFWVTWSIIILVFFVTYNLVNANDQKFLRLRNSMFEQEEIRDVNQ